MYTPVLFSKPKLRVKPVKSAIWISYDLGVNGDYEGLYSWFDMQGAVESGSSVAFLTYTHPDDLMGSLREELKQMVSLNKRSRIYVIRREGGRLRGSFLVGRRKGAPWEGYGEKDDDSDDSA